MTQPVNSHTSVPDGRSAGCRSGRRGRPSRRGTRRTRCPTASAFDPARSSPWWPRVRRPSRCHHGVMRPVAASVVRVPSISRPNGTPEGQAVSHPRHWTQASMNDTNVTAGLGVLPLHGPHGCDAPPWRGRLLPRHPVGGAVRQAQATADAAGQLVVVQPEIHGAAHRTRGNGRLPGPRPAASQAREPATSSVRGSGGRWGRTRPSAAGAAPRRRGPGPAARRVGDVDDAHAHLGDEGARQAAQVTGWQRPPPARRERRRTFDLAELGDQRRLGQDVGRVALEAHPCRDAVPQDRRRPVERAPHGEGVGACRPATAAPRDGAGCGGSRHPGRRACRSSRPAGDRGRSRSRSSPSDRPP